MGKEWMINPFDIMFTTPFTYLFYVLYDMFIFFSYNQYWIEKDEKCENNSEIQWTSKFKVKKS